MRIHIVVVVSRIFKGEDVFYTQNIKKKVWMFWLWVMFLSFPLITGTGTGSGTVELSPAPRREIA
jgi:hypothetical protein